MKLPDVPDVTISEISSCVPRERVQSQLGAVYVTRRNAIKSSQDMQIGTLAHAGFTHNREHLTLIHLKGQIVKEHQV